MMRMVSQDRTTTLLATLVMIFSTTFAFPLAGFAEDRQSISVTECGQVLSEPGDYTQRADVSCGCNGIVISASHVHFDTAGHQISSVCDAVEIADGVSHVRINGGGSLFGGDGLIIGESHDISVDDLTIGGDSDLGGDGAAIEINRATGVKVAASKITVSCGGFGITGKVDRGVFLNNTITGSCFGPQGITLVGTDNVVRRNTITLENDAGGGGFSYAISVTSKTVVVANTIELLAGPLGQPNEVGINLGGDSNRVKRNTIEGSATAADGILAAKGAVNNTIKRNTVSGNQHDLFESNGPPCVNVWEHNQFQTSGGAVACIN